MEPQPIPPSAVRLKEARTLLGLSLSRIGRLLDISSQTFNNWERGITPISPKIAKHIEERLGIGKDWLINGGDAMMFVRSDEADNNYRRDDRNISEEFHRRVVSVKVLSPKIKDDRATSLTEYLDDDDDDTDCYYIDARWLRINFAPNPYRLCLFQVAGNHMEPTIQQGELVFVNSDSINAPIGDGVWLLKLGDHVCVRRVMQISTNRFQAFCDNTTYPSISIDLNTKDNDKDKDKDKDKPFKLLGRVVGGFHKRY